MNFILKALAVIILIITSNHMFAQEQVIIERDYTQHIKKMYDYEFKGELNSVQQEQLREAVTKMQFVTETKIYYKSEKSSGMIRLLTEEYFINRETDFEFNIYNLKMLISKFNLTPIEYRSEIITK
jgi:predicted molibdopterin-dependent oxidoreductase YjgC